jgi:biopolymer transport protein TolR
MTTARSVPRDGRGYPFVIGALQPTMVRISPRSRTRLRSNYLMCYIDANALVAVLLFLFSLFANPYVSWWFYPHSVSVDMANVGGPVSMSAADKEDAIIVAVTREGRLFFRNEPVKVEWLPEKIRGAVKKGAENRVYIKSDARAKYGWVKEVLDEVRTSGVEKIGFLVDHRKAKPPTP